MIRTSWISGNGDLKDAHHIRRKVFIEEQRVSEAEEMDDTDSQAEHLVVYDGNEPVATGRILLEADKFYLGRIAVLKEHRGQKYGDFVVRLLIRKAFELGGHTQYLRAQTNAKGFYEKLGFQVYGEEFEEAGIPHVHMKRQGDILGKCN